VHIILWSAERCQCRDRGCHQQWWLSQLSVLIRECPVWPSLEVVGFIIEVLTLLLHFSVLDRVKDFLPKIEKVTHI
jgi:hypothetical protein